MKITKIMMTALLIACLSFAVVACESEGPAEKVGESIDGGIENTGEAVEDAGDAVGDAAEETQEKVKDATNN